MRSIRAISLVKTSTFRCGPGNAASGRTSPNVVSRDAVEAAVHSHQLPEASEQQAGADDQDDRQRDFRHHQRVASPRAGSPGGRARPAFVQPAVDALLPQVQQRREAEHDACGDGDSQREDEDPPVERDLRRSRDAVRVRLQQGSQTDGGKADAQDPAKDGR